MFHTVAYHLAAGSAQTLATVPAVTEPVLTTRNNNFILTDPFNLAMAYGLGSVITELRANFPTLNAYGFHEFWPIDEQGTTLSTVPDRPAIIDYWRQPLKLPTDEELNIQVSCTPGTTEHDVLLMWLATPNHQFTIPSGVQRLTIKATYSITPAAIYTWTGGNAMTFTTNFRGGWYVVVGLAVEDPGVIAARLIFPKNTPYNGRVLRPGCLVQQSYANRPAPQFMGQIGVYGFFNSFETPQIELLSTTTGAHTGDVRLDLVYMGDGAPPSML